MMVSTAVIAALVLAPPQLAARADTAGRALYESGCASCHGTDGRGPPPQRELKVAVPDFTDCSFSSREPDADWAAVVHAGGPVRAFDPTMPAFGEAFTPEEIQHILDYVRTFCGNARWPRGELNLPRGLFTEKAYPEDEAVMTVGVDVDAPRSGSAVVVYEKRLGAVTQLELELPLRFRARTESAGAARGIGDVGVAVKRVLWHSLAHGGIVSAGAEVVFPTGSRADGLGHGTFVFEPFVTLGKMLPSDGFVQLQGVVEIPAKEAYADAEAIVRAAVGRSFTSGQFGRSWTPMVELLGASGLDHGKPVWDIVPQLQVTLNPRQHVMASFGVRVPVNETQARRTQLLLYVLWDWFDGGFFDGW